MFTPGVYKLDDTLKVTKAGTIILGLGMPSLLPTTGRPVIAVGDVDGVTIAGLISKRGLSSRRASWRSAPRPAGPTTRPTRRSSTT